MVDYLRRFGYWRSPLTGAELQSADWAKCAKESLFYTQIEGEEEDGGEEGEGIDQTDKKTKDR